MRRFWINITAKPVADIDTLEEIEADKNIYHLNQNDVKRDLPVWKHWFKPKR